MIFLIGVAGITGILSGWTKILSTTDSLYENYYPLVLQDSVTFHGSHIPK